MPFFSQVPASEEKSTGRLLGGAGSGLASELLITERTKKEALTPGREYLQTCFPRSEASGNRHEIPKSEEIAAILIVQFQTAWRSEDSKQAAGGSPLESGAKFTCFLSLFLHRASPRLVTWPMILPFSKKEKTECALKAKF